MSSSELMKSLEIFARDYMSHEGVQNYEIRIEGNSEKGENYSGDITFFTVIADDKLKSYRLVVKTAKKLEKMKMESHMSAAYKRELFIYSKVYPTFKQFIVDSASKLQFDYVPDVYYLCKDDKRESLIMENLKAQGYSLWDRKKPMELSHIMTVLKILGKHHGISLAMRIKENETFKELTCCLDSPMEEIYKMTTLNSVYCELFRNAIQILIDDDRSDLAQKFVIFGNEIKGILCEATSEDDRLVICHGDCSNNNILFKYKDEKFMTPEKVKLIDFQMSILDSPVKDLSYFIYSVCDKSSLDNIETLLRAYYESLSHSVAILGCNGDDIFSYSTLKNHWLKYCKYGLLVCLMIIKIQLLEPNEAPDFAAMMENESEWDKSFVMKMQNQKEYNRRIREVFTHFGENFL